jgi:2,3-bisphosphoglycerate-dependent phosphoglycerate mutase
MTFAAPVDEQATRILAIRHGETAWNVDGRIQGQLDIPLNAMGQWQVHRLALALAGEGVAALYSSDLLRAVETAQAVARGSGLSVHTDQGLRERGFGVFEGLSYDEVNHRWPVESERWRQRDPEFAPPSGETLTQFFERSVATVSRLAQQHAGQTIAVVSHGGVMDCLYRAACHLALNASRTWGLGNANINRLLYTTQGFTLIGWSDSFHLDDDNPSTSGNGADVGGI